VRVSKTLAKWGGCEGRKAPGDWGKREKERGESKRTGEEKDEKHLFTRGAKEKEKRSWWGQVKHL